MTGRSPLKTKPLRLPGQSVDYELRDLLDEEVLFPILVAAVFMILAGAEWIHWATSAPPSPWIYTFCAALACAYAAVRIRRALLKAKQLRLGRDGERAVGQFLDNLRAKGAFVFHDIPGDGFNVDHVVIHPSGIYVIETKTLSKPMRGPTELVFDGHTVRKRGLEQDRNPIVQVKAAAAWLNQLLKDSTGRCPPVRPVVVYPGWYIEPTAEAKNSDVWVLNPKALPSFIEHSHTQLRQGDVNLFKYHLSRYVRAQ